MVCFLDQEQAQTRLGCSSESMRMKEKRQRNHDGCSQTTEGFLCLDGCRSVWLMDGIVDYMQRQRRPFHGKWKSQTQQILYSRTPSFGAPTYLLSQLRNLDLVGDELRSKSQHHLLLSRRQSWVTYPLRLSANLIRCVARLPSAGIHHHIRLRHGLVCKKMVDLDGTTVRIENIVMAGSNLVCNVESRWMRLGEQPSLQNSKKRPIPFKPQSNQPLPSTSKTRSWQAVLTILQTRWWTPSSTFETNLFCARCDWV